MNVTSSTNNYQTLNRYQKPQDTLVTLPVEPNEPTYTNKEVYEASQGNIIRDKEGNLGLTPQGQVNVNNAKDVKAQEEAAQEQAKKDATRGVATDYLSSQSKKSQVEIYLAVASDGKVSLDDKTPSIIESLRDVQKQNNAVEAYATYAQNQKDGAPELY